MELWDGTVHKPLIQRPYGFLAHVTCPSYLHLELGQHVGFRDEEKKMIVMGAVVDFEPLYARNSSSTEVWLNTADYPLA